MTTEDRREPEAGGIEATRQQMLAVLLASDSIDRFGFRMSLWAGLYAGPLFVEMERRFGLTRDENNVLFSLSIYGKTTAKVVSEYLGRPKNSISRAIEKLLRRELILSEVDSVDRRRIVLTITPAGLSLYQETSKLWRDREAHLLSPLSPVERVALDQILSKLMAISDWDGPT